MENKSGKSIHGQKITNFFSSMPVSKKVKLQETKDIVTYVKCLLER